MPVTYPAVQAKDEDGATITFSAPGVGAGNGIRVPLDATLLIRIGATASTATIKTPLQVGSLNVEEVSRALPINTTQALGNWGEAYRQSDNTVEIEFSSATGLDLAVVR